MDTRIAINGNYAAGIARCVVTVALVMALHADGAAALSTGSFDFESGDGGWTAVSPGVTVMQTELSGEGAIQVAGAVRAGNVMARSPRFKLQMLDVYRLTAILGGGNADTSPVIACRFQTMNENSTLGLLRLDGTGEPLSGNRRRVSGELRAPWGTMRGEMCVLAPDGGNDGTLVVEDVKLEPLEAYTVEGMYALDPVPPALKSMSSVHPRLFFDRGRIDELKRTLAGSHASIWAPIRTYADRLVKTAPPKYRAYGDGRYDEQWWQSNNSRSMATLALAWLMTGERTYLDAARNWAVATCDYPTWGDSWNAGKDCMAGHNLYGLAIVYDWCGDALPDADRSRIRETLMTRGHTLFQNGAAGTVVPSRLDFSIRPWPEWRDAYLQNHLWVNICGLMCAGLALHGEFEEAGEWIDFSSNRLAGIMRYLGPDGASHEGLNYWSYGVDHLLKLMYLSRDLLGIDHFDSPWFRATAEFRLHISLPRNAWTPTETVVEYADSRTRDNRGPHYLLWALAREYRDGHAQWLADESVRRDIAQPAGTWMSLLWYDSAVNPVPPEGLPTLKLFDDMGFVTARSDWSGDESLVFFKCGPYIGKTAIETMPFCLSSGHHVHPDQNHFSVFAAGQSLVCDDSYMGKYTGQHNTLLIDGCGQDGGGASIFYGTELHARTAEPVILAAESSPALDHFAGDAAPAYPPELGLERFARHLLFLKPDVLIVVDDIKLDTARDLELRFHPTSQAITRLGGAFITRDKAALRIEPLTTDGVIVLADTLTRINREFSIQDMTTVRLTTRGSSWRTATALSWCPAGSEPPVVKSSRSGDAWTFMAKGKTVTFDFGTGKAALK